MTDHESLPPAGWYPDPSGAPVQRYWDGTRWAAQQAPAAPQPRPVKNLGPVVLLVGAALAAIGSLLPWANLRTIFGSIGVAGTDGDGVITLAAAVVLALLALLQLLQPKRAAGVTMYAAGLCAVLIAGVGAYDWSNVGDMVSEVSDEGVSASVGAGLYLVVLGGATALVGTLMEMNSRARSNR
jgi:hypothetical protein